jgi:hypothetical protein
VRTNNHVERTNRLLRFLEKVRYKWRRRRTLVRFVVLSLDALWSHWTPPKADEAACAGTVNGRKTQPCARQGSHRAA